MNLTLAGYRGSWAHGTYMDPKEEFGSDDIDTFGIFVPDVDTVFGLHNEHVKEEFVGPNDQVFYSIPKFIELLRKGNPNTISMIFMKEEYYTKIGRAGELLLANKHRFIHRGLVNAFLGYAQSQLKHLDKSYYNGFENGKRAALREKFGFDTKYASHLIRLLRMCKEIVVSGEVNVFRADAIELLDIKCGRVPLKNIMAECQQLEAEIKAGKENVPESAKDFFDWCNTLCIDCMKAEGYIYNG